ncbi:MAG: DHH family phosphoesterase [Patescibacteria group bacterium]|nr:DHH family phosphoesterase [Patescibacteria group bacterium]
MTPQEFKKLFFERVEKADSILITTHMAPDGDAIASLLVMFAFLKEKYPTKRLEMAITGEVKQKWSGFLNFQQIIAVSDIAEKINFADLVIILDANQSLTITRDPRVLEENKEKIVVIDHHQKTGEKFGLSWVKNDQGPTAQVIYYLFYEDQPKIKKEIAELLYMGISSDTGHFSFITDKDAESYEVAARLIKGGKIKVEDLKARYSGFDWNTIEAYKELINNCQLYKIPGWPNFIATFIPRKFMEGKNHGPVTLNEASAMYQGSFFREVLDADWSIVLYPKENSEIRLSLRSKPDKVNVRELVTRLGIPGGGHIPAAGGSYLDSKKDSPEILEEILSWLKENKLLVT